jgi:hypothetical protein
VPDPVIDPEQFLEQLKAEHKVLLWEPLPPDRSREVRANPDLHNRESLEYLHHHWALPDAMDPADAGGGLRGKVIGAFGRLTFRVLGRYLHQERDVLAHLVRVNEALEQRCDELTVRCQQLHEEMVDRQTAEAANQAKLAAWLLLDPPAGVTGPATRPADYAEGPGRGRGTVPDDEVGTGDTAPRR